MIEEEITIPKIILKSTRRCPKWYFELFYHYAASARTNKEAYERLEQIREKYGCSRRYKDYHSFCRNLYRYLNE